MAGHGFILMRQAQVDLKWWQVGAVIKMQGLGISPGCYACDPQLLSKENRRKVEPKETTRVLIPHLLVVFTQQLEILATTLRYKC